MSRTAKHLASIFVLAAAVSAVPQAENVRIAGVEEPPEFTFPPQPTTKAFQIQDDFDNAILHLGDLTKPEESAEAAKRLDAFITDHPDYSDAYMFRISAETCAAVTPNFETALADVDKAIATREIVPVTFHYQPIGQLYALRAKLKIQLGQLKSALDDLDFALKQDVSSASGVYAVTGTEPASTSSPCEWNLSDFDNLVARFPADYRTFLLRGTYIQNFTLYDQKLYVRAVQQFQRSSELNPKSPFPPYFLGSVFTAQSFWTKEAAASDVVRNYDNRKAMEAYSSAIQRDPKFIPAYIARADAYYTLKLFPQSIMDYDRILELDPENTSAHSGRGIAYLEAGKDAPALSDFREQLRDKKSGADFLPFLYEYAGDAEMHLQLYRDAVSDYSHAIERRFAMQVFLLSLPQVRGMYPEYATVSDDVLLHKFHDLFYSVMPYDTFAKEIKASDGKWAVSLLNGLFEKRGDAYLKAHNYRRGVRDFHRIFDGIPDFADVTERWREIVKGAGGQTYYLDVKTAEFSDSDHLAKLWIKSSTKTKSETSAYEVICGKHSYRINSNVIYDADGKVTSSNEFDGSWQPVIPDTVAEAFYLGACPNKN